MLLFGIYHFLLGIFIRELIPVRIMGLWDTVGSLGVPETTLTSGLKKFGLLHDMNESYGYHDTSLPTPKGR